MHPHVWSLYFDFLERFRCLTYRGVPIALFCYFPHYTTHITHLIKKDTFIKHLNHYPLSREDFQPYYNRFLPRANKDETFRAGETEERKVVFFDDYLRFTKDTYRNHFNPTRTFILSELHHRRYKGFAVRNIQSFQANVDDWIETYQSRAQQIIERLGWHPFFGDYSFQSRLIKLDIPLIIRGLDAAFRLFKQIPVACVVTGGTATNVKLNAILPIVASMKGIPSISLQHGIIGADRGWLPVVTTKQAVYGEYEKIYYRQAGVPETQLEIVGHPRFDAIFEREHMGRREFCDRYKMDPAAKTVLITTQSVWHPNQLKSLIEHLSRYPVNIMVKLHPLEKKDRYNEIKQQYSFVRFFNSECHLYDLMANTDIAIVFFSTTGLETLLFDKPVIYMLPTSAGGAPYQYSPHFVQKNPKIIADMAHRLATDDSYAELARRERVRYLSKAYPEKQSAKKLSQLIEQLSGGRP
ncbi:CDP-glycerol glycerophosphotransferase family protein [Desmospora profundinema]|uniref:UDP-N-acetylglucosamine 2-epimerase domain-containing protein n=1 Tax=Desmospora profundinema TaxID=1571184 RepID=A0ABU1IHS3_9BACL|nr:CDP-glycerol glycerophosphotransferase family protein [Desmospora profundinema]MDR6224321.1 hypothetical protein [Desmospora profundinema]